MATIYLSNPEFFRLGEGGQSAVVGIERKTARIVRYTLTSPDVGASHIKIRIINWYDEAGTYPDRLRCAITTDPTSHANAGPGSPYDFRPYRDGVAWTGEADCILVPSTTYYVWIYPDNFDVYGYMWWGTGSRDAVLEASGAAATVITGHDGALGDPNIIELHRYSSAATHNLSVRCGDVSMDLVSGLQADSYRWTPPIDWAAQNATGPRVSITITCGTYIGGKKVGTSTAYASLLIPERIAPTCNVVVSDPTGLLDELGSYVQGHSKARIQSYGAGTHGSWTTGFEVYVAGKKYTGNDITVDLPAAGSMQVVSWAIDSRGRRGSAEQSIDVAPYHVPQAEILKIYRCDADGTGDDQGDHATVVFNASVTGLVASSARYTLKYRVRGAAYWTAQQLPSFDGRAQVQGGTAIMPADPGLSYECTVEVVDKWPPARQSPYRSLSPAFSWLQIDKDRTAMGIMQQAGPDNAISIGKDVIFNGPITLGGMLSRKTMAPGDDANSYTDPGLYDSGSNAIAKQVKNLPTDLGGLLFVYTSFGDREITGAWVYITQVYRPFLPGAPTYRRLLETNANGTWKISNWYTESGAVTQAVYNSV